MATNSSLDYPAEYYYPEFIESRPDDPLKITKPRVPATTLIEKSVVSSTQVPIKVEPKNDPIIQKKSTTKREPMPSLGLDVATDQGLPDIDITRTLQTDPKKSLLRDPASRNIPRLIVDDNVIKQTGRTPRIKTTNLDNAELEKQKKAAEAKPVPQTAPTSYPNDNYANQTGYYDYSQQYPVSYVEDQKAYDDYWKKQMLIDNEGVVTIEPIKHEDNVYSGPFGLTRQGAIIFYVVFGVLTLLAGVFLIVTGVFYANNYPDSSTNTAKLTGIGVCGFVFYVCLQLILIGLWHQKYREENPKKPLPVINKQHELATRTKSSVKHNEPYNYSYEQQVDYTPYNYQANPPYVSNANEQMLLRQPGAATGAAVYQPVVWPSNVEIETQSDPRFYQPMDFNYGSAIAGPSALTPAPTILKNKNNDKKIPKKTITVTPPKADPDNLFPNSIVTETRIHNLSRAPETKEMLKTIEEQERALEKGILNGTSTTKGSNRVKPYDVNIENSTANDSYHRNSRRHHSRHSSHPRRRRRRHSYSSCSSCSSYSNNDSYSDVKDNQPRQQEEFTEAAPKYQKSKPKTTTAYRSTGLNANLERGAAHIEDIPNTNNYSPERAPIIRHTVISDSSYPDQKDLRTAAKSHTNTTKKNIKSDRDNNKNMYSSTQRTPESDNVPIIQDLQLQDVNDNVTGNQYLNTKSRKKKTNFKT